ncbi:MAG: hypothetical protein R3E62_08530 [Pseudomonadales bacterium]
MAVLLRYFTVLLSLFCAIPAGAAPDLKQYLDQYFSGAAIQYGYGSGTSSSNPRVELTIHYCASGLYFSSGQSCRPNLYASGYQCTGLEDAGQWRVATQGGQAVMQWLSNQSGPGGLAIQTRSDGMVVDARGNPFYRVGPASCR